MIVTFGTKLVDETITIQFNFANRLAVGEAITAGGCAVEVFSGTDADPEAILSGAATLDGTIISQVITAGVAGVTYLISCQADTDDLNVLINQGRLSVLPENSFA
jgi:hypothetical protein